MDRLAHDVSQELRDPRSGKWSRGGAILDRMAKEVEGGHERTHAKVAAIQPGGGKNIGGHWVDRPASEGGKYRVKLKTSDRGKRDVKIYDNPEDAARAVHTGSHASPSSERAAREAVGASPSPSPRPEAPAAPGPSQASMKEWRQAKLREIGHVPAEAGPAAPGPSPGSTHEAGRQRIKVLEDALASGKYSHNPAREARLRQQIADIRGTLPNLAPSATHETPIQRQIREAQAKIAAQEKAKRFTAEAVGKAGRNLPYEHYTHPSFMSESDLRSAVASGKMKQSTLDRELRRRGLVGGATPPKTAGSPFGDWSLQELKDAVARYGNLGRNPSPAAKQQRSRMLLMKQEIARRARGRLWPSRQGIGWLPSRTESQN